MDFMRIKQKLLDYTFTDKSGIQCNPIAIVGPQGKSDKKADDRKLRAYAFGGRILSLSTEGNDPIWCDDDYPKYLTEDVDYLEKKYGDGIIIYDKKYSFSDGLKKFCNTKDTKRKEKNDMLVENIDIYLDLSVMAACNRMCREEDSPNERRIQTRIVRNGIGRDNEWCIVDMEYYPPKDYLVGEGKQPDLVVYDFLRNQFGIIELKYKNDSVRNLRAHYDAFEFYYKNPIKFTTEMKRRVEWMFKGEIISQDTKDKIMVAENNKIWFGFLFVGGSKKYTKTILDNDLFKKDNSESMLKEGEINDDYRMLFWAEEKLDELNLSYNQMEPLKNWY